MQSSAANMSRMAAKIEPLAFIHQAKSYVKYKRDLKVKDHKYRDKVIGRISCLQSGWSLTRRFKLVWETNWKEMNRELMNL